MYYVYAIFSVYLIFWHWIWSKIKHLGMRGLKLNCQLKSHTHLIPADIRTVLFPDTATHAHTVQFIYTVT